MSLQPRPALQSSGASPISANVRGERRQVTALFYDIVDSTALLNSLDPEDFAAAQRLVHARAKTIVERHGGYLERILGDGGCAYFGYPEASEDAAECAVAAALEIAAGAPAGPTDPEVSLSVRVGVATGVVVLNSAEGTGLPTRDEIVGLAPTLAARIQAEARPGTVAAADTTYAITRQAFAYEPIGSATLKGFAEPQRLWRAVARLAAEDRFSAHRRAESPLVARDEELELCRRRWMRAREGQGQVVVLAGEPGIGKSRLVAELRRTVEEEGGDIRILQCQPRGETQLLHPFLDALKRDLPPSEGADGSVRQSLEATLARVAPAALPHAPLLAFLMDRQGAPAAPPGDIAAGEEAKLTALEAVLACLEGWSQGRAQFLVLEDLHWADGLTQALLAALAERADGARRLVVATTRAGVPTAIAGEPHVLTLSLSRLGPAAVDRLVGAVWAPERPSADLVAFVRDRSDGIPLFVEEVAQLLKDRAGTSPGARADWERALKDEGIVSLRDFIAARLAGLGDARRVAQVASVIGREFSHDLLEALAPGPLRATIGDAILALAEAGLVRRRDQGGQPSYRFRHVLIQEAAYGSLLRTERRTLHQRIVDLVREGGVGSLAEEALAWHCEEAGRWIEAAQHALRAAEACAIRSAPQEALTLLDAAAANLARAGDDPRAGDLELQALATRGPAAMAVFGKGSAEAQGIYERGVQLCEGLDPDARENWFPIYWGWWITAPDAATQLARSRTLVRNVETTADPEVRLQSFHCAWATTFDAGEHARCLACIEHGLALYDPERAVASRARYGGHDARVCALGERAHALWCRGEEAGVEESLAEALRWAEEIDHLGSRCHALECQVILRRFQEDLDGVIDTARAMADFADAHSLPLIKAKSQIYGGWARARMGAGDGIEEFAQGLATLDRIDTDENVSMYVDMEADLLGRRGEADRAIARLSAAIDGRTSQGQVFWLPELRRRRALLRQRRGEGWPAIRGDLEDALALATAQGALALARRARADLERLAPGRAAP